MDFRSFCGDDILECSVDLGIFYFSLIRSIVSAPVGGYVGPGAFI